MTEQTDLAVRKSVVVAAPIELAFQVFTEEIGSWWPLATHSVFDDRAVSATLEGHIGGRIFETRDDGEEEVWGKITDWSPPSRLAMTWHPGADPEKHTDVEVLFTSTAEGTRVELVHTGWERRGLDARRLYDGATTGWSVVLERYVALAAEAA